MRDEHAELWAALSAPFRPDQIRHRPGGAGRQLAYITARDVMDRLDEVLGPSNWWDDYQPEGAAVICRLTVRLPDGSTITKTDAGAAAGMDDPGDDGKSAYSDALKRAAIRFGVARHLEGGGGEGSRRQSSLLPSREKVAEGRMRGEATGGGGDARAAASAIPTTGRALYGWAKENDLIRFCEEYGRDHGFPRRMIEWRPEQIAAVVGTVKVRFANGRGPQLHRTGARVFDQVMAERAAR